MSKDSINYLCPMCKDKGKEGLLIKDKTRYGLRYYCSNYYIDSREPKINRCPFIARVDENGKPLFIDTDEQGYEKTDFLCPICNSKLKRMEGMRRAVDYKEKDSFILYKCENYDCHFSSDKPIVNKKC